MEWFKAAGAVSPYTVKIETPGGHGTGFLCFYGGLNDSICGIATAHHVVQHSNDWQEPLRLVHGPTEAPAFIKSTERAIFSNPENDSAVIIFPSGKLNLPKELLPLLPADRYVLIGAEVAWLGFPAVAPASLCFFGQGNHRYDRIKIPSPPQ